MQVSLPRDLDQRPAARVQHIPSAWDRGTINAVNCFEGRWEELIGVEGGGKRGLSM